MKVLEFQHFVRHMAFGRPYKKGREKFTLTHLNVSVEVDVVMVDTKNQDNTKS